MNQTQRKRRQEEYYIRHAIGMAPRMFSTGTRIDHQVAVRLELAQLTSIHTVEHWRNSQDTVTGDVVARGVREACTRYLVPDRLTRACQAHSNRLMDYVVLVFRAD